MLNFLSTELPKVIDDVKMIWVAEYKDGSCLFQRDLNKNTKNSFYTIQKEELRKFGLIGMGYNCYFDTFGGNYYINDRKINIRIITEDNIHFLTEQNLIYNDIITFIDASAPIDFSAAIDQESEENISKFTDSRIDAYNVGYKTKITSYGYNFNLQTLVKFPETDTPFMNIYLNTNKDLKGNLIVMVDNSLSLNTEIELKANHGGELNWTLAL